MHIKDVETFVVGTPHGVPGGQYFIFVKLVTDGGVVGYGEAYGASFGPQVMAAAIEDLAQRHLVGHDPHDVELFFRRAYSSGFTQRPDLSMMGCFSALEMACWDIIGKEAGKPVHKLLGGQVHESLRSYTYLYPASGSIYPSESDGPNVYNDPVMAAEAAAIAVADGFTAVKFDPAGPYTIYGPHQPLLTDITRSAAMVKAVRDAVGDKADILFGTHGQFTPSGALRMAKAIEPYDPLWFEEPVPPDNVEGMAKVAGGTRIPVAAGERLTTRQEFAQVLKNGRVAVVQPNCGRSGGILETKKIAAVAEIYQAQIAPHCYCGPLVAAANIQLAATCPNFLVLEAIKDWSGFHAELLNKPLVMQEGYTLIPDEPGLGVELNEAVARANQHEGRKLHLEMLDKPVRP